MQRQVSRCSVPSCAVPTGVSVPVFPRHSSFLVMQRGKLPSAYLHKGVGGPLPPPPPFPGPPGHASVGDGGDWDLDVPPPNPSWMPGLGRDPHGPRPAPPDGESPPILSPVVGGALPCAVHSLSLPPHSKQPLPRRAPLAPALPAAFSWLHYLGEPTRVRGSPGPPRTLPLSKIPRPCGTPLPWGGRAPTVTPLSFAHAPRRAQPPRGCRGPALFVYNKSFIYI